MIYKKLGKTVIVTDATKVYTMTGEKEDREKLTGLIDKLNGMKSEKAMTTFKNKQILPLLTVKEEAAKKEVAKKVTALKGEKKLEKKKVAAKKVSKATKSDNKELVLAASLEDDLKLEQDNQELKNKNATLEEENRKLKEALNKTKAIVPVPSNTGVRRSGEH